MPSKNGTGMRDLTLTVTVTIPLSESTTTFAPGGDCRRAMAWAEPIDSPRATTLAASREASVTRTWVRPSETIHSRRKASATAKGATTASSAVTIPRSRLELITT